MLSHATKRLLMLIPVFFIISIVIFLIIHLVPGDPIDNMIKIGSTPEQRAELAAKFGLDRPLLEQYVIWITNVLRGDLGNAIVMRRPVADLIAQNLPYSVTLGLLALAFSTTLGVVTGAIAATLRGTKADQAIMTFTLLGSTVPGFWLGLLLILVFAVILGWVPVSGARTWEALILPVVTIGLGGTALVGRVARVAMIDTAQKDFVLLLHAKGLSRLVIQVRHVLRHALLPVVTILGLRIGFILGGAIAIEFVFARPGLGSLLIRALNQRDYPVVQGCLLILSMAVVLSTLIADLVQAAMDPRIREHQK